MMLFGKAPHLQLSTALFFLTVQKACCTKNVLTSTTCSHMLCTTLHTWLFECTQFIHTQRDEILLANLKTYVVKSDKQKKKSFTFYTWRFATAQNNKIKIQLKLTNHNGHIIGHAFSRSITILFFCLGMPKGMVNPIYFRLGTILPPPPPGSGAQGKCPLCPPGDIMWYLNCI